MVRSLSTYEAKSRFSAVLQDIARGETVIITRHGRPIARIIPEPAQAEPDELLASLRQATREAGIEYDWNEVNRPLEASSRSGRPPDRHAGSSIGLSVGEQRRCHRQGA